MDSEQNFKDLAASIHALCERYQKRIIFSVHPRTQKKILASGLSFPALVEEMKPLGFADYCKLQKNAFCVISDSGTITEESSLLRFPAITVRQAHERPEGMDVGTLIMSGLKPSDILSAIETVTGQLSREIMPSVVPDYDTDNVSEKVVRIIMSYTKYIRRTVWREEV
ncbi:hypothetical protein SDC9_170555 [bioreactor metagenome]|uniref:UDP-N-acetylglucosamine 2-epimerase domain-containing protein n=1 Tax=bioreactor metagenome TaxID=1076179 RepID=A0A645G8D2_9ZZZZ